MPPTKLWSSADFNVVIARVTPDVLALLGDGVPRTEAAVIQVPYDYYQKNNIKAPSSVSPYLASPAVRLNNCSLHRCQRQQTQILFENFSAS
jgi:hypothetical protein